MQRDTKKLNKTRVNIKSRKRQDPQSSSTASGQYVQLDNEVYFQIANSHAMAPFFMSLIGASDHWMFVASNGALTAGRQNSGNSLFPYYSSDKLINFVDSAGPKTIVQFLDERGIVRCWEPFSDRQSYGNCVRNIYKNIDGSKVQFEEVNLELELLFRYSWEFSEQFGFVRTSHLANTNSQPRQVSLIDGLQNILPYGMDEMFQLRFSNLGNAYKKSELAEEAGVGLFYLSSIPTDRAEPSEGLRATVAWQHGLESPDVLLSDRQLDGFRRGESVAPESDVRGTPGAFLLHSKFTLPALDFKSWTIVADLKYDQADVVQLCHRLKTDDSLLESVTADLNVGKAKLAELLSAADGIQVSEDRRRSHRHQSNVIFNLMRGGAPFHGYDVCVSDFVAHVKLFNRAVFDKHQAVWESWDSPAKSIHEIREAVKVTQDPDLIRVSNEYLPFWFARRHGDPTRPWNKFSIDLTNDDGERRLNYEGNWRDIFQNWEALGVSYPGFLSAMVLRFLNASTADGYNPYRITKSGFDWERPDPSDPWANIGYWGDHQIIYLQKLMEWMQNFSPQQFREQLTSETGVYADLPYRIRSYEKILEDPCETIDYDHAVEKQIEQRVEAIGTDGQLLTNRQAKLHRVTLLEKMLLPALVKMSNFIPDAGIWLNTQRPEWNDANNALVGDGASVVTVCYLRRFLRSLVETIKTCGVTSFEVSAEVMGLFADVEKILESNLQNLASGFSDQTRRDFVDQLQTVGSNYRGVLYGIGFSGEFSELSADRLEAFGDRCVEYLESTISRNRREDGLYHSYNLVAFGESTVEIERLREMLEGQVAVLSSQWLQPAEAIEVLTALRASKLYREDVSSYLLYPDRDLPTFIAKNCIDLASAEASSLIQTLVQSGDERIVLRDVSGQYRFNGDFRNAQDLAERLEQIRSDSPEFSEAIGAGRDQVAAVFEETFEHRRFTGRSETFFGYEGLNSVYWHMVSKLGLAVLETHDRASQAGAPAEQLNELKQFYREVREGLGVHRSPASYGAFPTDPYSHTPGTAGAQQPGMTGQVKEDVLARMGEIGVRIREGVMVLDPSLFEEAEFLTAHSTMKFTDIDGKASELSLSPGSFAFTVCQVPFVYRLSEITELKIHRVGQDTPTKRRCNQLTLEESRSIFERDQTITRVEFSFSPVN
ncbi:MAG: hypothetical protein ACI87E_002373 [Mariniblastus sp.]|jgi:hypothetical protein